MQDVCASGSCGDGTVQPGEDCEPGMVGCLDDCTFADGAASIALGHDHTCAVTHFGQLRCWGSGDRGKLGLGSEDDIGDEPGEVAAADDVEPGAAVDRVALGSGFSCALLVDGVVVCWGYRANGRLGDGLDMSMDDIGDEPGETAGTLGQVSISDVVDLAVGGSHACALRDTGQVYCWGTGMGGRLGYANEDDVGVINNPSTVGPVFLPEDFKPRQLAAGAGHTCALSTEGDVRCWGDASEGILGTMAPDEPIGDDEFPDAGSPVQLRGEAVAITAGSQHTCALMDGGAVKCWGLGDHGRLGYGSVDSIGDDEVPAGFTVDLPGRAVAISAGRAHTCALLDDGAALCWGDNGKGQLGRGDGDTMPLGDDEVLSQVDPIQVHEDPDVAVVAIETGGDHTCAVLEGGGVRCWGDGGVGQLGYGNKTVIGDDEPPSMAGDVDFLP